MSSSPDLRQVAARPGGELVERPRPERLAPLDSRRARGRERARVDPRGVADVDLSFSDSERLPVGNAGLILLWPFLGHFFSYLGLAEGGALLDPSARMRAAGLLQVVATGARDIVEYQLPLPKLLVGLDLFDVIEFGEPVTDAEDEECGRLLSAVIERAPILGAMSIGGLRGSFLLREGLLSSRDESWLLQVERRAYDIVLDRFPWSLGWVKLPWMVAPMQVEW